MISVYFSGRLGNQLFQYAYARFLKKKRGDVDNFVFNFGLMPKDKENEGFENSLQYFNIENYELDNSNINITRMSFVQKIYYILFRINMLFPLFYSKEFWYKILGKKGYIYQICQQDSIFNEYVPCTDKVVVYGKFENPNYLKEIRSELLCEFVPKHAKLKENEELYSLIDCTESVCISIRRGDFLSSQFKNDFFVCDKAYFERAISKIKTEIKNPTIFFFSDDIEWVKENIKIDLPCYYESGNDPVWEKLRLMYSCKHFVISNSTFSWWAQYLGQYDKKIVISPRVWYNNNWKSYLLEDEFIKV